jgi:hypothetical protein
MAPPGHLALTPEIDAYRKQFEQLSAQADALVSPLTEEQFTWRAGPDIWSIAQCFDHLNATARCYLSYLDEGIADAIRRGLYAEGPFIYRRIGRVLVAAVEPPPRLRTKAPASVLPRDPRRQQEVMPAFRAYQVQYVDRLRQANGLDLGRAAVRTPISRWLWMSLGSGFALMAAHERRHLAQAKAVSAMRGFPA